MKWSAVYDEFICPTENGFFGIPDTCGPDYYQCIDNVAYSRVSIFLLHVFITLLPHCVNM